MSQENVEIAKRLIASFADQGVEAVIPYFDPQIEWTTAEDEPDHQTYVGHDGIRRLYAVWSELWAAGFEAEVEPEEFRPTGELVIVPTRVQVHGRSSGIELEIEETYVFKFASGRIVRVQEFRTKPEALEAAGLTE